MSPRSEIPFQGKRNPLRLSSRGRIICGEPVPTPDQVGAGFSGKCARPARPAGNAADNLVFCLANIDEYLLAM